MKGCITGQPMLKQDAPMPRLLRIFSLCLGLGAAQIAPALADSGTFDLSIRGLTAGVLQFSGSMEGKNYSVTGSLKSSGIAAMVRRVSFQADTSGRYSGGRWQPARYREQADTGKRRSQSLMEYKAGIPAEMLQESREGRANYVDPATQGGTVDPLTALFAMLRDVPVAQACQLNLTMFDGARRSQIALDAAVTVDGAITCPGEYRRLKGFSDKEMAEKQSFSFRVTYGPADQGRVHVVTIAMDTLYGRAALTRR